MPFSCFRSSTSSKGQHSLSDSSDNEGPAAPRRPRPISLQTSTPLPIRSRTSKRRLQRNSSATSSSGGSWCSNESIARLPPCRRDSSSDSRIQAMMMPVPDEAQLPSRCLRLSHPKTYSDIVADMKKCKGTRDWRNFAVFYNDEIDESVSAVERAKVRAKDCEAKIQSFETGSFGSVDMIG